LSEVKFGEVVSAFRSESCASCEKSSSEIDEIIREKLTAILNVTIVD